MARKILTTREAIVKVLRENGGEMTTKEVVAKVIPLAKNLKARTKEHTVYTTMLAESKKPDGLVVQVKPGLYRARIAGPHEERAPADASPVERPAKPDPKKPTRKRRPRAKEAAAA